MPFIRTTRLHSDEIEEIIGQIPPSLIRTGIAGLFFLILILVLSSMLVRYPSIIHVRTSIYPSLQPYELGWRACAGCNTEVKVKEGAIIKAGDTLIVEHRGDKLPLPHISPIGGKVKLLNGLTEAPGGNGLTVIPTVPAYKVMAFINSEQATDVKAGQHVSIHLDDYKSTRFGTLDGLVTRISKTTVHNNYLAEVNLPNGLTSNRGRLFFAEHPMSGDAEITIANHTIFQIIFRKD